MRRRSLLKLAAAAGVGLAAPLTGRAWTPEDEEREARVDAVLQSLTLDQKISQLMMSYPPLDKTGPVEIGAAILVGNLLKTEQAVLDRVHSLQSRAKVPLFIAADVEGGGLNKLAFLPGLEDVPSNRDMAKQGLDASREWGRKVGAGMKHLGINMALAPVLDLASSGMMWESGRSFGADPEKVGSFGKAFSEGLAESDIVAVGKHWPGYGALEENTDHHLVVTQRTEDEVQRQAQAFVHCGDRIAAVMLANVGYSSYGATPAILSSELVELAHTYGWLTITDDLAIDALAEATGGDKEEVVRRAFLAGNDILLTTAPIDWDKALDYRGVVKSLVVQKPELVERVEASARRILRVKARIGLI